MTTWASEAQSGLEGLESGEMRMCDSLVLHGDLKGFAQTFRMDQVLEQEPGAQAHFLLALGRQNDFADLHDPGQSETERLRARLLFKNLIHPEGLGETFQVSVQHKGVAHPHLTGFQPL